MPRESQMSADNPAVDLKRTPLYDAHVAAGARMVAFAGYAMPVQYPLGVLKEHLHTRAGAGLFDVSHMGQAVLVSADRSHSTVARALEALVPADLLNLGHGRQRYTQLLDDAGGIIDDLMVTRPALPPNDGTLLLIVNASRKDQDYTHISARLPDGVALVTMTDRALVALQGPAAKDVVARLAPGLAGLGFLHAAVGSIGSIDCHVSRSGYTGEDGFEISVPGERAAELWRLLAEQGGVQPIGLGARDSLRLEAGLCLYGNDIDETTSPVEAGLTWSIQKRRREQGGFPGVKRILRELSDGPSRSRVGLRPEGRAPARQGAEVLSVDGDRIGVVTSGGFGPSVDAPIAMGYVAAAHATPGTPVQLVVRGKPLAASVAMLPFTPHRYVRKS